MENFTQMLNRAHIQQLSSFFIDGVELDNCYNDKDYRSYKQRIQEAERPIWRLLEKTFHTKKLDKAAEKLSCALVANQHVYMEIGMKAGAMIIFDLLQESLKHGNI